MEKRLYLVSFGHSDMYLLADTKEECHTRLAKLEKSLNDFLRVRFPDETFAYFTTPRVTEVEPEHLSRFANYPRLDDKAVEAIKRVLVREVEDMNSLYTMNRNAPYADTNPGAAGVSF